MHTSTAPVWTATTLTEALRLRAEHPEATVLAGGTDLMVFVESGAMTLDGVLNIWGCEGLSGIASTDEGVRIGAMSTWRDVRASALMPDALRECAATVGAAQIQNRGTVGGNIVNGSPAGDSLPLWLALDAQFEVASVDGSRRIAASEFWTGYRQNAMQPNELLVAVHITPVEGDDLHFRKVGTRMAQAISKVVLGGRIRRDGERITEARVALGSVAATPVRLPTVEAALVAGEGLNAAEHVQRDIAPIDDIRSTSDYRMSVAKRIVQSWIGQCLKQP